MSSRPRTEQDRSATSGSRGVSDGTPVLSVRGLGKRYGSHWALRGVSLDFAPGEVHVLFGENGAGKSTLISMLAGAGQPTEGSLSVEDFTGGFRSVTEAREHGVRAVFQEFSLVPNLTVADNIVLGDEATARLGLLNKSAALTDRKSVRSGKSVSVRVDLGGSRIIKKKKQSDIDR